MKPPIDGSSPQALRRVNASRILEYAWDVSAFTASDAMASAGLTRSTVIGVCDELVGKGWLEELSDARAAGVYSNGRPARRYALRSGAAVVVGVDAGYEHMSATVADLRGRPLARTEAAIPSRTPQSVDRLADADARRSLARNLVRDALVASGYGQDRVLAITIGVPAPVDGHGVSPSDGIGFWRVVNPGFHELFTPAVPVVTVENDANLAAVAERTAEVGHGREVDSYIAMLAGEGIGAGLMIDRRLVRGRRGGAGEMRFLDRVEGVGSSHGLALLARRWAAEAIRSGSLPVGSMLAELDADDLSELEVAEAAASGDAAAADIIERLARRLAQICIVLGDLLDVDLIVMAGALVSSMPAVVESAARILTESDDPSAPRLVSSRLAGDAVATGAVEHAVLQVREHALDLLPVVPAVA